MMNETPMESDGYDASHDSGEFPRPRDTFKPRVLSDPYAATSDIRGDRFPFAMVAPIASPMPWLAEVFGGVFDGGVTPKPKVSVGFRPDRPAWSTPVLSELTEREVRARMGDITLDATPAEDALPACFGAEPFLLSARHDLMAAADQRAEQLRNLAGDEYLPQPGLGAAADLLDRLAAYLKGGDDRLIAAGREVDGLRNDVRAAESAFERQVEMTEELRALIRDACPAVRLVNDWATWSDDSLRAYVNVHMSRRTLGDPRRDPIAKAYTDAMAMIGFDMLAELRGVALKRLDGSASPPTYSEEDRSRAIAELMALRNRGHDEASDAVDTVAEALGMVRAGA